MPILPPRRWFQFSLSNWFVLVAILAWAMWLRPMVTRVELQTPPEFAPNGSRIWYQQPLVEIEHRSINPALLWPAIAFTALIIWNAGWIAGQNAERRKVGQ